MSAYVCSPEHIKVLAIFASSRTGGYGYASLNVNPRYVEGLALSEIGRAALAAASIPVFDALSRSELANLYAGILYQENIRSCYALYDDCKTLHDLPGLIEKPECVAITTSDECNSRLRLSPVAILKMCDGLEYQSCETEDYRKTTAFNLLQNIRRAAIRSLPGYEDSPWSFNLNEETQAA